MDIPCSIEFGFSCSQYLYPRRYSGNPPDYRDEAPPCGVATCAGHLWGTLLSWESKMKSKRRKFEHCANKGSAEGFRCQDHFDETKEDVLLVPKQLTQSAYAILKSCHVVPHSYHLEGRFGSRTHSINSTHVGLPLLSETLLNQAAKANKQLHALLQTPDVSVVTKAYTRTYRCREPPAIDGRIHPEREIPSTSTTNLAAAESGDSLFSYAELFAGIGGFGVALEALGGHCVFASELEEHIRALYCHNLSSEKICGDIYNVEDSEFPCNLDLVVGGFPCQPFSALGTQSGFDCEKGRGLLYLEIVRLMKVSRPRAFLLENVPGLLTMKETYREIVSTFQNTGYQVTAEVCCARGLTATNRKRLFLVGIRNDIAETTTKPFEFPFVPDLKLRAEHVLDYDTLHDEELQILRLADSTFDQLSKSRRWRASSMAWPNRTCDTLTSHYGNAVGRGESQLVPCRSPHHPRRFSVRECARLMGFPNSYRLLPQRDMQGNAVCPPLVAALAGAVLAHCNLNEGRIDWVRKGRDTAIGIALSCTRTKHVDLPIGCQVELEDVANQRIHNKKQANKIQ
eukprot:scaffold2306_cov132-Cylindrotheca_fusiformis.AAC.10